MTFERTFDYALLNQLLRNPAIFSFLGDDFSPGIEDAEVVENPNHWYILGREDDGKLLGFWGFFPQSAIVYEFHTVMPLDARALVAMRELLGPDGWLWRNTPCRRAVTNVPGCNAIARRFGLRAGLQIYGENPDSFQKDGELHSQILMGVSKPKVT